MEFLLLGPFEVVVDDRVVTPGAAKQRALLARLLVSANEPLASTLLIEDLWDGRAPATAAKVLQTYVSQLRRLLGSETIASTPGGYELRVGPGELDVDRFERLVAEAADLAPEAAEARLQQAFALWRGQPLADFGYDDWARAEIARLEELRLSALRRRIDCHLALGQAAELVGELELLVTEHPLDEGLHAQLMLALYRAHRQAEALAVYRQARSRLVEQLGIEPGPALRRLEAQILRHDPALEAPDLGRSTIPAAPPLGLPTRTTRFIGRHAELLSLRRLLQDPDARAITLTGPAGIGKTRLALEAAAVLEPDFPDGIVFVDLAPIREPDKVVATIAETLGLGETPGRARLEVLIALLHRRRILLLLDNFEQVQQAAPVLQDLLDSAARVKLLVTSRGPLGLSSERIEHIAPLSLPDRKTADVTGLEQAEAVRLFVDRARAARPEFALTSANAEAVVELCVRLDGLPLALELAAARCNLLSPRALLERLDSRLDLLRAAPGSGLTERQWTLRGAIEWSYELLDDEHQQLFASLGVFVGGFTLGAAEHVADQPDLDILEGVESLVQNNLLTTAHAGGDEPRVGMLESIREYALERLAARGDGEAVRRRHADFYLGLAEEAEPGLLGAEQPVWLDRLAAELDNIRAALTWTVEAREAEVGLRIGSALWRFWQLRDHVQEGRERLEDLLALGSGSPSTRATAQTMTGALALHSDLETGRRLLEASLAVHRRTGNARMVANALGLLGMAAVAAGETDKALDLTREALETAGGGVSPFIEGSALWQVGVCHALRGELDEAERTVEEAVNMARKRGDARGVAGSLKSLGGIALMRGNYPEAWRLFDESLTIHRDLNDPWGISNSLSNLALVALETGEAETSRSLLSEALAIERTSGQHPCLANALEMSAKLAAADGEPTLAVRLYARAALARETDTSWVHYELGWPNLTPILADLRSRVGSATFEQQWARGREMTIPETIDQARGQQFDDDRHTI